MVTLVSQMASSRPVDPNAVEGSDSPSGIKTAQLCLRKWGYEKLAGLESPSGPAAQLGTDVHTALEAYFRTGAHPSKTAVSEVSPAHVVAAIAETALPHYPAFGEVEFHIERHIHARLDGFDFHGFQDLGWYDNSHLVPHYVTADHKTTSDWRWAKTVDTLGEDPQAMIYALAAMQEFEVSAVELRWVYMRTRGKPSAQTVRLVVDRPFVERSIREHVIPTARLLRVARQEGATAEDMPQNPSSCGAYGGCPFRSRCNLSPMDKLKAEWNMSSLREKALQLKQQQSASGVTASADAIKAVENPESPSGAINPPESRKPGSLVAQLSTGGSAMVASPSAVATASPAGSMAEKLAKLKAASQKTATTPSEVKSDPFVAKTEEPPVKELAETVDHLDDPSTRYDKPSAVDPPVREQRTENVDTEPVFRGYVLLIGCVPIGESAVNAGSIAAMAHREWCEKTGNVDYRLVQYAGVGAAQFLAFFEETVEHRMPRSGLVYADPRNPYVLALMPAMEKHSALNIRAVEI